jgi:hypothetical protein
MSTKAESAGLILKLYDLPREETMRKVRNWFFAFSPEALNEIFTAARGEHGAYCHMGTSYWDMACSLVKHGVIDEDMFDDANAKHVFVYAKIRPLIEQIRAMTNPQYLSHLNKLVRRLPEAEQRLAHMRGMSKSVAKERAQQQQHGTDKAQAAL